MTFNPIVEYTNEIHRKKDKDLSDQWKKDHDSKICGGVDQGCYICAKKGLFDLVRDVLKENQKSPS